MSPQKNRTLSIVVLILAGGSLLLAIIDPNTRPFFSDLSKVCIGIYFGQQIKTDG
jgi:hypothetical protein